jgi:hypothetical protein
MSALLEADHIDALERRDAVIIINARAQTASDSSHDQ